VWVTVSSAGALQKCTEGSPSETYSLNYTPAPGTDSGHEIVVRPGFLYVTQGLARSVARVDLGDMSVRSIPAEGPTFGAAPLDDTVWVNTDVASDAQFPGRLFPINGATAGTPVPIAYTAGYMRAFAGELWVAHGAARKVGRYDPVAGTSAEFDVPSEPLDVLVIDDEIWVTLPALNQIAIIDSDAGTILEQLDVGGRPLMLVEAFGSVWVTNGDDGTVSRIDPLTRAEIQPPIEVGRGPLALAAGDDRVFVANYSGSSVSVIAPDR
jgi:hypothetical protein